MKKNGIANLLREFVKKNDRTLRILVSGLIPLIFWKFLMPESYYASPYVIFGEFALYFLFPVGIIGMIYGFFKKTINSMRKF